jgi:hypothetical protein
LLYAQIWKKVKHLYYVKLLPYLSVLRKILLAGNYNSLTPAFLPALISLVDHCMHFPALSSVFPSFHAWLQVLSFPMFLGLILAAGDYAKDACSINQVCAGLEAGI